MGDHGLPDVYRRGPWRTLRAAELAGNDPTQVLADALAERDLAGARDIPAVIDAQRHELDPVAGEPPGEMGQ